MKYIPSILDSTCKILHHVVELREFITDRRRRKPNPTTNIHNR